MAHKIAVAAIALVAAVLLLVSLRGIEWKLVAHTIVSIQPAWALAALLIGIAPMLLRAARWRVLLEAQAPVSLRTTFWAIAAGYFGNNFLPARGGEFVRSFIVRERSSLSGSYVLATALSERAADAVALVVIGAGALVFAPQVGKWMNAARGTFALIGIAGTLGLWFLPSFEKTLSRILGRFPRLQGAMEQVLLGVRSLHSWRRLSSFVILTAAIWALDALATATLAHALAIPLPISVAMLLIVALSLSSALPSTPGYVGVYQFVSVMVLKPFGISPSAAIAFILVTQALSYVVTSTLGLLALTRFTPFNWRAFRRPFAPIQTQN